MTSTFSSDYAPRKLAARYLHRSAMALELFPNHYFSSYIFLALPKIKFFAKARDGTDQA